MLLHSLFTKLVIQEIVLVVSGLRTVYYWRMGVRVISGIWANTEMKMNILSIQQ